MTATESPNEIDRIDPVPDEVTLLSGTVLVIKPLRARAFFKLLRIITRGGASMLAQIDLSLDQDVDEFVAKFLALVVFALPEADEETLEFIRAMVAPKGLTPGRTPAEKATNDQAQSSLDGELEDPELEDLVSIIEIIVKKEGADLWALGKRLMALFQLAERTGQTKEIEKAQKAQTDSASSKPVATVTLEAADSSEDLQPAST